MYSKAEITSLEKRDIEPKLATKFRTDMRKYAKDPKTQKQRTGSDTRLSERNDEAELLTQRELDEALELVQSDAYVRGVDGAEFGDVARGLDEAMDADSKSYETRRTEINTMAKKLEEAKRNGDSAAVRALEEEISMKKTKADYDEALRKLKEEC